MSDKQVIHHNFAKKLSGLGANVPNQTCRAQQSSHKTHLMGYYIIARYKDKLNDKFHKI